MRLARTLVLGALFACAEAQRESVPAAVIGFTVPTPVPTGTRAGIRTRSMNASFEWVMIFETR